MFSQKKPQTAAKPNGVDVLIQKLGALPPAIDLMMAVLLGGYSFVAIYVDNAKLVGLVCILMALIFAMLGISAVMREMKAFKLLERGSTPEALRSMKTQQFEHYLIALFSLDGYRLRSAIDELHRQDDADLIAVRKKEILLIQFNHWDEDTVTTKHIQSLHKAATVFRATGCIAITFGRFSPEATDWAVRKGVGLMTIEDVIDMACRLTGTSAQDVHPQPSPEVQVEQRNEIAEIVRGHHRFLIVDFAGIDHGLTRLNELLLEHPAYQVVASSIPMGKTIESVREGLGDCGGRLIGEIAQCSDGRYFAIQNYLLTTPEGKQATWLALDSEPRQYPEGCSELIAVNRAFGFDSSAAQRLLEAMLLVDKRASALAAAA